MRLDDEDLAAAAAAAMLTVLPNEEALALEVALVRLGAMANERSVQGVLHAGKKGCGREEEFWGERDR